MRKVLFMILTVCLFICLSASFAVAAPGEGPIKATPVSAKAAAAEKEDDGLLTYEAALELALKNSITLRNEKQDVLRAQKVRDQLSDMVRYTPVGFGNGEDDERARSALSSFISADTGWQLAKKQVEIREEKIAHELRGYFNEMKKKVAEIELAVDFLAFTELKLQQTVVKNQIGVESNFQLQDMQKQVADEKKQIEILKKQLGDIYLKLNHLQGKDKDARYELAPDKAVAVEEEKAEGKTDGKVKGKEEAVVKDKTAGVFLAEDFNLERHISRVLANDPVIWMQEQKINLAELELSLYTYNTMSAMSTPYAAKEIDLIKEKNNLTSLRQGRETAVRAAYSQFRASEDLYRTLEIKLARAEEGLAAVRIRHKVGMAVASDVRQAELNIAKLEHEMNNILVDYAQAKTVFDKPWLQ